MPAKITLCPTSLSMYWRLGRTYWLCFSITKWYVAIPNMHQCVCIWRHHTTLLIKAVSAISDTKVKQFFARIICKLNQILCCESNDVISLSRWLVISAAVVWTLVNTSESLLPLHMSGVSVDTWFVARPADRSKDVSGVLPSSLVS